MRRSEQIIKAVVWGLCVCLGGYLAARGYLYLRQSPGERAQQILGDVCMEDGTEAYLWYMPGIFYEEGNTTPMITKLWTKIENWYPLGAYLKEQQEEESHPVIEDESTCYEMIHANGNTIADRLLGENQSEAVTQENETAKGKSGERSGYTAGEKERNRREHRNPATGAERRDRRANRGDRRRQKVKRLQGQESTQRMQLQPPRRFRHGRQLWRQRRRWICPWIVLSDFQYLISIISCGGSETPPWTVHRSIASTFLGIPWQLEEDSSVPQISFTIPTRRKDCRFH